MKLRTKYKPPNCRTSSLRSLRFLLECEKSVIGRHSRGSMLMKQDAKESIGRLKFQIYPLNKFSGTNYWGNTTKLNLYQCQLWRWWRWKKSKDSEIRNCVLFFSLNILPPKSYPLLTCAFGCPNNYLGIRNVFGGGLSVLAHKYHPNKHFWFCEIGIKQNFSKSHFIVGEWFWAEDNGRETHYNFYRCLRHFFPFAKQWKTWCWFAVIGIEMPIL